MVQASCLHITPLLTSGSTSKNLHHNAANCDLRRVHRLRGPIPPPLPDELVGDVFSVNNSCRDANQKFGTWINSLDVA